MQDNFIKPFIPEDEIIEIVIRLKSREDICFGKTEIRIEETDPKILVGDFQSCIDADICFADAIFAACYDDCSGHSFLKVPIYSGKGVYFKNS